MKKLLAVLLLTPTIVLAQSTTYRANNKNGGQIILTDKQCTHKEGTKLKHGYSYSAGGKTLNFCWYVDNDGMVKAIYLDDFTEYTYPGEIFTKVVR